MPQRRRQQYSSVNPLSRILLAVFIALVVPPAPGGLALAQGRQATKRPADEGRAEKSGGKASLPEKPAEGGAVSTSKLALPFKRAWLYADDITTLATTADEARIYLPLVGGRVVCLDRDTGARIWMTEPGGIISSPVAIGDKVVYVASRKLAEDGTEAGAALRAVDKMTGLTLWARDYPRAFTSALTVQKERLYAGAADGGLYAIAAQDGAVVWRAATQDVIRGGVLVGDGAVYFGSDDGAVRGVEWDRGRELWRFQTQGAVRGTPVADEHTFYFGSGDGSLYAVDKATGRLKWRSRTGAAIEAAPVPVADKILVASFDNFVYALSRATGNKIWKRRMENRLTASPLIEGDALMVAPIRGDHVAVFLQADGKRVNYYRLEKEMEIVSAPVFAGNLLLLATNKGLLAAVAAQATEPRVDTARKGKP